MPTDRSYVTNLNRTKFEEDTIMKKFMSIVVVMIFTFIVTSICFAQDPPAPRDPKCQTGIAEVQE
jgi:hypothetical protein